jgi:hypothetical protein
MDNLDFIHKTKNEFRNIIYKYNPNIKIERDMSFSDKAQYLYLEYFYENEKSYEIIFSHGFIDINDSHFEIIENIYEDENLSKFVEIRKIKIKFYEDFYTQNDMLFICKSVLENFMEKISNKENK